MGYSFILRHKERFLEPAQRLIWWMKPEEALEHPLRLVTQIMDIGTLSDLRLLQDEFTEVELVSILKDAPSGVLSARSLRFWQVVLKTEVKPQPRFPGSDVTGRVWSQG